MTEISSTKFITKAQVKAIHIAIARRGIDEDDYRDMLRTGWGVDTCKALTRRQASEFLRHLGARLRNPPGSPRPRARPAAPRQPLPKGVTRLASPEQRQLIGELAGEVAWREADGYQGWLKKNQGIERVATTSQAARVIEGLKALKKKWPAAV